MGNGMGTGTCAGMSVADIVAVATLPRRRFGFARVRAETIAARATLPY
jgi:hypothetical protein